MNAIDIAVGIFLSEVFKFLGVVGLMLFVLAAGIAIHVWRERRFEKWQRERDEAIKKLSFRPMHKYVGKVSVDWGEGLKPDKPAIKPEDVVDALNKRWK